MIWLALALLLLAASGATIAFVHRSRRRRRRAGARAVIVPADLVARLAAAARSFAAAAPWQPSTAPDAPATAAAIEAALIAREPRRALAAAESALAAAPGDPAARVWLAWALCASAQPAGALDQLHRAGDPAGPLSAYVAARATHLRFEHNAGATGAIPPLVTTADLAVVTLASGRGSATWLTGATDVALSADQVRAAIAEHRELTARCLAGALDALDAAPGFTDAAYLAARLAVKAGLVPAARTLFDALAPRIAGRPDADAFERDRRDLEDPAGAVAAAKLPPAPTSDKAKRSRSLRVLS
jgi:hypothetical protein